VLTDASGSEEAEDDVGREEYNVDDEDQDIPTSTHSVRWHCVSSTCIARMALNCSYQGNKTSPRPEIRMEDVRRHFGMTQDKAARSLGITKTRIREICSAAHVPWPVNPKHTRPFNFRLYIS